MICKNCHVQMEDDVTVCPVCGAEQTQDELPETRQLPVEEAEKPETAEEAESPEAADREPAEEEMVMEPLESVVELEGTDEIPEEMEDLKPSKRKLWIRIAAIACCAVLVLGLGLGLWTYINGGLAPRENDIYFRDTYTAKDEQAALKAADKVVATVGDRQLTNGELQVFFWMEYYGFLDNYSSYLSYFGLDPSAPLSQQYVTEGGATWEQYFLEAALQTWHSYQSMILAAEAEGHALSEALQIQLEGVRQSMNESALSYGYENGDALVQADMGATTNLDAYCKYLEVYYGGMEHFERIYNSMEPSQQEIEAYYHKNADTLLSNYGVDQESGDLIDVRHILVSVKGGTTDENGETVYSDEEWETCRLEAEAILEQWKNGEATEDSFAALAAEKTEDPGSSATGGLYTMVYQGQMVPTFDEWCFDESRQTGDTGLVKSPYGYHVMYFVYGDAGWIRCAEQDLISSLCTAAMEKIMEEYPADINYKKIALCGVETLY